MTVFRYPIASAVLRGEHDGHRVLLSRREHGYDLRRRVVWIMCNPSTADGEVDDATVRKCTGFSHRWGAERFDIVNLWSYRSRDVRVLDEAVRAGVAINHDDADTFIDQAIIGDPLAVVVAWGAVAFRVPGYLRRVDDIRAMLRRYDIVPMCLGETADGMPRHPLTLAYATKLQRWSGHR